LKVIDVGSPPPFEKKKASKIVFCPLAVIRAFTGTVLSYPLNVAVSTTEIAI
jgi:hypothetical protein